MADPIYVTLSDSISLNEPPLSVDFMFAENIVGNFMGNYFLVLYIENVKAISVDMATTSAVVYQVDEQYDWIGYGGMQNIRKAKIQADVRVINGLVTINGMQYDSYEIISQVVSGVQVYHTHNFTVNGNRVLFIKLDNGSNLLSKERGEEWLEFIFEVDILTNNF
jgi:hypothetical protein